MKLSEAVGCVMVTICLLLLIGVVLHINSPVEEKEKVIDEEPVGIYDMPPFPNPTPSPYAPTMDVLTPHQTKIIIENNSLSGYVNLTISTVSARSLVWLPGYSQSNSSTELSFTFFNSDGKKINELYVPGYNTTTIQIRAWVSNGTNRGEGINSWILFRDKYTDEKQGVDIWVAVRS